MSVAEGVFMRRWVATSTDAPPVPRNVLDKITLIFQPERFVYVGLDRPFDLSQQIFSVCQHDGFLAGSRTIGLYTYGYISICILFLAANWVVRGFRQT